MIALDLTQARLLRSHSDEQRDLTWIVATYPGNSTNDTYEIQGWSDGTAATCTCPGYVYRQRCKHVAAFPLIVEELERQWYTRYPTPDLCDFRRAYEVKPTLTNDQRLALGAICAVLATRKLTRSDRERLALVTRGRRAAAELLGA